MEGTKLTRSSDRIIAGVCAGIAEHIGWSPNTVRLAYLFVSIISAAFPGILVYGVLWVVMPRPPEARRRFSVRHPDAR